MCTKIELGKWQNRHKAKYGETCQIPLFCRLSIQYLSAEILVHSSYVVLTEIILELVVSLLHHTML